MKRKYKKSQVIPIALLCYLAGMSYIGRDYFYSGHYSFYFGVIGSTLLVILLLYFSLRKRERLAAEREKDMRRIEQEKNNATNTSEQGADKKDGVS